MSMKLKISILINIVLSILLAVTLLMLLNLNSSLEERPISENGAIDIARAWIGFDACAQANLILYEEELIYEVQFKNTDGALLVTMHIVATTGEAIRRENHVWPLPSP